MPRLSRRAALTACKWLTTAGRTAMTGMKARRVPCISFDPQGPRRGDRPRALFIDNTAPRFGDRETAREPEADRNVDRRLRIAEVERHAQDELALDLPHVADAFCQAHARRKRNTHIGCHDALHEVGHRHAQRLLLARL